MGEGGSCSHLKLGVTAAGEAGMEQAPVKVIIQVQAKCRGEKLTA